LTAIADDNSIFDGWQGDCNGTQPYFVRLDNTIGAMIDVYFFYTYDKLNILASN